MIRLTRHGSGKWIYVNPDHIVTAEIILIPHEDKPGDDPVTCVHLTDKSNIAVAESDMEVADRILDYRLQLRAVTAL